MGKTLPRICAAIDCRNQTIIFYVQGNQENRHRCATLADMMFPDPETRWLMRLKAYSLLFALNNVTCAGLLLD